MAENESGQEKSEKPTGRRLAKAREKGQVPQSKDFNTMAEMIAGAVILIFLGGYMIRQLSEMLIRAFTPDRSLLFEDPVKLKDILMREIADGLLLVSPILFTVLFAGVVAAISVSGLNFSTQAISLKLDKLNPITGLKRIFSVQGAVQIPKTLAKFVLVLLVAELTLWAFSTELIGLGLEPFESGLAHAGWILTWGFLFMACALILIAAVDVPFQKWNYLRQQRMTKKEVKDEHKDTEGDPQLKGRIRRMQVEMAQRRMMAEVPTADVVVTNPTHFAVALRYEQGRMGAPRVVAKGADLIAAEIRRVAMDHKVPIFSAPPLARAIYFNVKIDQEIPAGLFIAVAQVLAYVYQLKAAIELGGVAPVPPIDLPVPEAFLRKTPPPEEA